MLFQRIESRTQRIWQEKELTLLGHTVKTNNFLLISLSNRPDRRIYFTSQEVLTKDRGCKSHSLLRCSKVDDAKPRVHMPRVHATTAPEKFATFSSLRAHASAHITLTTIHQGFTASSKLTLAISSSWTIPKRLHQLVDARVCGIITHC
jgi:hypothetical protein